MKKILPFAALIGVAAVFLSCSNGVENGTEEQDPVVPNCKISANEVPDYIKGLDGYKQLDPACKSEDRKLVSFYDISPEIDWDYVYSHLSNYVHGTGQVEESGSMQASVLPDGSVGGYEVSYNVNGIEMNQEEYSAYKVEYQRKYEEELEKSKKALGIPCVVEDGFIGLALLTDEEIADLKEKHEGLSIADYDLIDYEVSGGGSENGKGCGK